jgi:hypothetical protein
MDSEIGLLDGEQRGLAFEGVQPIYNGGEKAAV